MGQSQFMPSSYLSYAVDFNNDKKIDIWNTHSDVFASIANYLKVHGWKKKLTMIRCFFHQTDLIYNFLLYFR